MITIRRLLYCQIPRTHTYHWGITYGKQGLYDKAFRGDFNAAIALDQKSADGYHNRGYAYYLNGMHTAAIADFKKACSLGNKTACDFLKNVLNRSKH